MSVRLWERSLILDVLHSDRVTPFMKSHFSMVSPFFGDVSRSPIITTCRGVDVDFNKALERSLTSKVGMHFFFDAKNSNAGGLLLKPSNKVTA